MVSRRELYSAVTLINDAPLRLDTKMGIESQGIDRVHEDKKEPPSIWNVGFGAFRIAPPVFD